MHRIDLAGLPVVGAECGTVQHHEGHSVIAAGPGTDAFVPPDGGAGRRPAARAALDLPRGALDPDRPGDAGLCRGLRRAGALMLRAEGGSWAKLAFEQAPDGRRMAVSVVTKDTSDDGNGPVFATPDLHLRACFTGKAHALHTSTDGRRWDLLRFFALPGRVQAVDIIAQSPTGQGCVVRVDSAA